jgi:hypothetical protein
MVHVYGNRWMKSKGSSHGGYIDDVGRQVVFFCLLTSDGKAMIAQNEKIGWGGGMKACWNCDEPIDNL